MCECEGGAKRTHPWGYSCIVVGAVAVHSQLLPASGPLSGVINQSQSSNTKLPKLQGLKHINRPTVFVL